VRQRKEIRRIIARYGKTGELHKNRVKVMEPEIIAQPPKTALLVLGCPQVPVQTSIALYLISRLKAAGITPVIAGNKAANTLLFVADPDRHYLGEIMDLDRAVAQLTGKKRDFDRCFVFIHNDAGISYAATMGAISNAKLYVLVYGEHQEDLVQQITFPCTKIAAKAVHNPLPLKKAIDEVAPWAA
jgi:hypothetical protein